MIYTPRLYTESVRLSVLKFPPIRCLTTQVNTTSEPGKVFRVAHRFTENYFPPNALVHHAKFGVGVIKRCEGPKRLVTFEKQITKAASEFSNEEWPHDADLATLINVSWIDFCDRLLPASDLVELKKDAGDPYKRWGMQQPKNGVLGESR